MGKLPGEDLVSPHIIFQSITVPGDQEFVSKSSDTSHVQNT